MPKKKTLIERRMDSDKRIITSAIQSFGKLGYTGSSIRDIASGAGITSGLITQRYGSKENLFLEAYLKALQGAFTEVDILTSPRECMNVIIHDIERLSEEDPDVFCFCCMLHEQMDYPKEILRPYQEQLKSTNSYLILKNAQAQGIIPAGDLDLWLSAFGSMVFHNVNLCNRYHQEYSKLEDYLNFVHFNDAITLHKEKWNHILETAISNTFDFLVYVNIAENKGEILLSKAPYPVYEDFSDVRKSIVTAVSRLAPLEEQGRLSAHLNLDTLGERMRGRKSVSCKITDFEGKMLVHSFLPLTWDENGTLSEVFAGIYRVWPNGMPD